MKLFWQRVSIIAVTLLFIGCAQIQGALQPSTTDSTATSQASFSPEAQIVAGSNALTAAITLATVASRNDKITVTQAKTYRAVFGTASVALDDANRELVKCRTATGSTMKTSPDPCKASVAALISMALDTIASAKRNLDAVK